MKKCAYSECNKEFIPSTHNMKYCCDECCRIATNLKIKQKYYENKERLRGKKRYCSNNNCNNVLSRYNTETICQECVAKQESGKRNYLLNMVKNVSG